MVIILPPSDACLHQIICTSFEGNSVCRPSDSKARGHDASQPLLALTGETPHFIGAPEVGGNRDRGGAGLPGDTPAVLRIAS